ncbi:MAG: SRPBCC family protein [Ktedonobacterales bacterium]
MLTIEAQTNIRRPVHEVFAFLADFTHMPLWNYYINSVTQVSPGPLGMGTVFDQVRRSDRQQYAVTELLPDQQVAVHTLPPARPLTLRFCLTPVEQGTQVIETWDLDTGLPGLLERLSQPRVRAAVATNLSVLSTLLESGEARLPDGRTVQFPIQTSR